ncbi:MAG: DUF3016 domain-containing protein [Xanthomonadales bacterium]|nr:DUF3016 domain-containing protein [Xanthomonadales bacterium]
MNMSSPTLPCLVVLFALASTPARAADGEAPRITVAWPDVATLSETKEAHGRGWQRGQAWLEALRKQVVRTAERTLAPDERLDVTFTDIKLAGSFEPWRGPQFDDVRIVKDIYPPRIDLRFVLRSGDGQVIAEGERTLRDPGFLTRSIANANDPLRYEKRMLDEWLRREFGKDVRKSS